MVFSGGVEQARVNGCAKCAARTGPKILRGPYFFLAFVHVLRFSQTISRPVHSKTQPVRCQPKLKKHEVLNCGLGAPVEHKPSRLCKTCANVKEGMLLDQYVVLLHY